MDVIALTLFLLAALFGGDHRFAEPPAQDWSITDDGDPFLEESVEDGVNDSDTTP